VSAARLDKIEPCPRIEPRVIYESRKAEASKLKNSKKEILKALGANEAKIKRFGLAGPGEHVGDWEAWLYPLQPPH